MFLLPDFPGSNTGGGKWLFTEEEQKLAVDRIQRDRVSIADADESIMHGLKLAVTDYRTWIFVSPPREHTQQQHHILTCATVTNAMCKSLSLRLQQLFPNHCEGIWARLAYDYTGMHSSAIPHWHPSLLCHCFLQRPPQGARLPHFCPFVYCCRWVHHHGCYTQRASSLFRILPLHRRLLRLKCYRLHMGSVISQPDCCKESLCHGYCQHYEPDGQHLFAVLFPSAERPSLCPSHVIDDGILDPQHLYMYVYEGFAEAGEQKVVAARGGDRC